ncbi:MAG TPA: hypothetical protein DDX92_02985 [Flavobacteriales bacterium]|jgi:hypothetical protein|nr:hypothetical protein [Flavobacteriales bacterium]
MFFTDFDHGMGHVCSMSLKRLIFFSLLTFSLSVLAIGQSNNLVISNFQWFQYYNQSRITDRWSLFVDGGFRWENGFEQRSQYIIRSAAGYSIRKNTRLSAGIAFLGGYSPEVWSRAELRPFQEFSTRHPVNSSKLTHRLRLEERFLHDVIEGNIQPYNTFLFRFRYLFMFNIPLVQNFRNSPETKLFLLAGNEILLHLGENEIYSVFDQNRILVGPGLQVSKKMKFTLLYNGMYGSKPLPYQYQYNNIVWVGIRHNMDWSHH